MKRWVKRAVISIVALAVLGAAGYYGYERYKGEKPTIQLLTATVSRGSVVQGIDATGRLQAVTTVQVGSQVSGTIKSLYADFNSQVRKGQLIAELEPSLFQTQVEQAEATVVRAQADVERARVQLEDTKLKLARAKDLSERKLLPQADFETAEANNRSAEAALKSAQAQLVQGQASLNQNKVNLGHTVITAPIDGVVINRNVSVGQTVAASMQAPTLFEIANDLTQMQVSANIAESDIGVISAGQPVRFQVDAYPGQAFTGTVSQVRLNPVIEQNVVSYVTMIDVPNTDMRLRPGMTANVTVEVARADDTLRVPTSAVRFTPTPEVFAALGQPVPETLNAEHGRTGRDNATASAAPGGGRGEGPAVNATDGRGRQGATPNATDGRGRPDQRASAADGGGRGGAGAREGGGARDRGGARDGGGASDGGAPSDDQRAALRARLQQMTPEERQAFFAARGGGRGGRGGRGGFGGGGGNVGGGGGNFAQGDAGAGGGGQGGAAGRSGGGRRNNTGDGGQGAFRFRGGAPGVRRNAPGQVWTVVAGKLTAVPVRVGISGGANMAVTSDVLKEGDTVATGVIETTAADAGNQGGVANPLLPQGRGRGQFFGFGGGGNRGGGGGGAPRGGGGGGRN
jgi:HlyD family secretion protein